MQDMFEDCILRCTIISANWEGNLHIKLEPYKTIMVKLRLEDCEIEILDYLAVKVHKM
jgi:hypothetical protein